MQILSHKLTSADGVYYNLLLSAPIDSAKKVNPNQPIILCLPAMGVPARKYIQLAESLNKNGFVSAVFELRGIESSSVRASRENNFGYNHILSLDLPEAIEFIRSQYEENPIYLLGHSLGGQLALLYMSINPQQISGLIGIATGSPYFKGWRFPYNIGILILAKFMSLVSFALGYFPGRKLGFGGQESQQLIKDWSHSVKTGHYVAANVPHNLEEKIKELVKTALILTIEDDFLAPPSSSQNLGNKLANSEVIYQHLDNSHFKNNSTGHFNWMREPEPITALIKQWIENKK